MSARQERARSDPGRPVRPPRTSRPSRARTTGLRPLRIAAAGDESEARPSTDRVLLLRFEWETADGYTQPVLLALPERLD